MACRKCVRKRKIPTIKQQLKMLFDLVNQWPSIVEQYYQQHFASDVWILFSNTLNKYGNGNGWDGMSWSCVVTKHKNIIKVLNRWCPKYKVLACRMHIAIYVQWHWNNNARFRSSSWMVVSGWFPRRIYENHQHSISIADNLCDMQYERWSLKAPMHDHMRMSWTLY